MNKQMPEHTSVLMDYISENAPRRVKEAYGRLAKAAEENRYGVLD